MSESCPVGYPIPWAPTPDIPEEWKALRERSLVEITLPSGEPAVLVTRYKDVRRLFADERLSRNTFGRASRVSASNDLFGDPNVDNDPPRYLEERSVVMRAFSARRIEALRVFVKKVVIDLLDEMEAGPQPAELMEAFAYPLPILVICQMLGVPAEDRTKFRRLIDGYLSVTRLPEDEVEECRKQYWDYLTELIDSKRAQPGDDLISELIEISREDPGKLTDYQLQNWVKTLLIAGYVTTASQLGTSMAVLLHRPEVADDLKADLSLVPSAVEELLRYQIMGTSLGTLRYAVEDIELSDGAIVPKGSSVLLSQESNHDEEVFEDPLKLDIRREDNHHLTFGAGIHFCAGAALARMELQEATEGLLQRFPGLKLAIPGDELVRPEGGFLAGYTNVPVTW
ncbi:cytochrome P450 [Streptomyces sp. SID13666]|uniref:cytochrome P450 n=1 Tax=unclassified Streptomyces TaxID=2593676 RepID=UPI0013BF0273|nr:MULTISPECIES: cytochrome P450 [unclassified Streptomyces]NEA57518.1 cytochrome P450 [Streptomyces sp. SID13666]NEA70978.1 cytochrome P450 [Streptomyces sp. SID13588]